MTSNGTDDTDYGIVRWLADDALGQDARVYIEPRARAAHDDHIPIERVGAYEATNGYSLFSNKGIHYREPPASWQDPDETYLDRHASRMVLLSVDAMPWNMPVRDRVSLIEEWLAKTTPSGEEFDVLIMSWQLRSILAAGMWPSEFRNT